MNDCRVEVLNRQRRRPMDVAHWSRFAGKALCELKRSTSEYATIVFVSDRAMRKLNGRYRARKYATDVLSFPGETPATFNSLSDVHLGDVVISVERAATQAAENDLGFEDEIAQLILHGLLHLCGYDHETDHGEMNRFELRLRRRLSI